MEPAGRRSLIVLLSFVGFAVLYSWVALSAVLTLLAKDFGVTAGTAGLVAGAYGGPAIVLSLLLGPISDRFGRKVVLVSGTLLLGIATVASAFAPTFPLLIATRVLAGIGGAGIFANVNAIVGDSFPYNERGRVASVIIAVHTAGSIVGVPIAGIVAEALSWRAALAIPGALLAVAGAVLLVRLPDPRPAEPLRARALFGIILSRPSAVAAITSNFLAQVYWMTWGTYVVVFLQLAYGLSAGVAASLALFSGTGVFVGSLIGGRVGDRLGNLRVAIPSTLGAGIGVFVLTHAPLGVVPGVVVLFLLTASTGVRFATNSPLLSEQAPEARGTLFALASSSQGIALVLGASLGGVLIDSVGFGALGVLMAVSAALSSGILFFFVHEPAARAAVSEGS